MAESSPPHEIITVYWTVPKIFCVLASSREHNKIPQAKQTFLFIFVIFNDTNIFESWIQ